MLCQENDFYDNSYKILSSLNQNVGCGNLLESLTLKLVRQIWPVATIFRLYGETGHYFRIINKIFPSWSSWGVFILNPCPA